LSKKGKKQKKTYLNFLEIAKMMGNIKIIYIYLQIFNAFPHQLTPFLGHSPAPHSPSETFAKYNLRTHHSLKGSEQ
jgi:hypothetical protein